eukprot:14879491-Alexandrium_andersonii.AAC.1
MHVSGNGIKRQAPQEGLNGAAHANARQGRPPNSLAGGAAVNGNPGADEGQHEVLPPLWNATPPEHAADPLGAQAFERLALVDKQDGPP